MNDKRTLRTELRARRAAAHTSTTAALELSSQFRRQCYPKLNLLAGTVIGGYVAIRDEINPAPILKFLEHHGFQLCLPVMVADEKPLIFRSYKIGDDLGISDIYRVQEPITDKPIITPEAVFVPLVGFDRRGNRIGSGKGFYDRTLASLRAQNKNTLAIGLAFIEQEVEHIPVKLHDQRLNIIVTPRETIYCQAA